MLKNSNKVLKAAIILAMICFVSSVSIAVVSDVVNTHIIASHTYITTVSDTDGDNIYDTYKITVDDQITTTYSICDIGDLSKWPPTGVPTVSLTVNTDSGSFTEVYTTQGTICKFIKSPGSNIVSFVMTSTSSSN